MMTFGNDVQNLMYKLSISPFKHIWLSSWTFKACFFSKIQESWSQFGKLLPSVNCLKLRSSYKLTSH